jgi:RNA binding exosome subunit
MERSPIEEIREIRHQLAEKFDNDVDRIFEDLLRQQNESGRKYIRLPKREPAPLVPQLDVPPADQIKQTQ